MGDFVIKFPNPDHPDYAGKKKAYMSLKDANLLFEEGFKVEPNF